VKRRRRGIDKGVKERNPEQTHPLVPALGLATRGGKVEFSEALEGKGGGGCRRAAPALRNNCRLQDQNSCASEDKKKKGGGKETGSLASFLADDRKSGEGNSTGLSYRAYHCERVTPPTKKSASLGLRRKNDSRLAAGRQKDRKRKQKSEIQRWEREELPSFEKAGEDSENND